MSLELLGILKILLYNLDFPLLSHLLLVKRFFIDGLAFFVFFFNFFLSFIEFFIEKSH